MLVDAECNERYQSFPDAFLPASMQTSRPDIVILQNVHAEFAGLQSSRRRDPRVIVHLIEIGLTSDLFLHVALDNKREQHAELCSNLTAYDWANVRQHEIVLGHTGAMLTQNLAALQTLGVSPVRSRSLLKVWPYLACRGCVPSCLASPRQYKMTALLRYVLLHASLLPRLVHPCLPKRCTVLCSLHQLPPCHRCPE